MSPDYTSDEMAFVAVTPDHIDVFSLHAGLCDSVRCHTNLETFFFIIYLFILLYLIIF